ncbi:MAG: phage tail tube protein [Hyphomicrobiaceae bacterium]
MSRTVGGRVSITLDGVTYHPVADVEVEGSRIEVETVVNQDGTIGRSVKPKAFKVKITYRDMRGLDMEDLMSRTFDFSMIEQDTGRSILLSAAFHEGSPSRNSVTGEISGLTVVSDQYRMI